MLMVSPMRVPLLGVCYSLTAPGRIIEAHSDVWAAAVRASRA